MTSNWAYIIFFIISTALSVLVIRTLFSIPHILRNQRVQTRLLAEIARKHGVDSKDVEEILSEKVGF